MMDNFNKRIDKKNIKSVEILNELEKFNEIFYDIYE
jgi:hypothetical protein